MRPRNCAHMCPWGRWMSWKSCCFIPGTYVIKLQYPTPKPPSPWVPNGSTTPSMSACLPNRSSVSRPCLGGMSLWARRNPTYWSSIQKFRQKMYSFNGRETLFKPTNVAKVSRKKFTSTAASFSERFVITSASTRLQLLRSWRDDPKPSKSSQSSTAIQERTKHRESAGEWTTWKEIRSGWWWAREPFNREKRERGGNPQLRIGAGRRQTAQNKIQSPVWRIL